MQRRDENAGKARAQGPRNSSAYLLALSRLDEIIAQQRTQLRGAGAAAEARGDAPAQAAEVQTLPDGNHGETLEVTKV